MWVNDTLRVIYLPHIVESVILRKWDAFFYLRLTWWPPAAQLGPMAKTHQKLDWKNSGYLLIVTMPATVWQDFNLKCLQRPEMEVMFEIKKIVKSNEVNYFGRISAFLDLLWASNGEPFC